MKNYFSIILLCGILVFQFLNFCSDKNIRADRKADTLYIVSKKEFHNIPIFLEKPVPFRVEVPGTPGATVTIPQAVDSALVVRLFFTKNLYFDSIVNDSIRIYLKEQVYMNELTRLSVGYRWTAPTMVLQEKVNRQLLFAGLEASFPRPGLYGTAYFDTERSMYGFGYDPFNKQFKAGAFFKFQLWKKKRKPR